MRIGDGEPIALTKLELRLLQMLLAQAGRAVNSDRLLVQVWGHRGSGDRQLLKQLVHRLRHKIEANPAVPQLLQTAAPSGYKLWWTEPQSPVRRGAVIWSNIPPLAKCSFCASFQPPKWSMLDQLDLRELLRVFRGDSLRRAAGRNSARRFPGPRACRGTPGTPAATARVPRRSTTLSTTATDGSASTLIDGTTISNDALPCSRSARCASFSQEMATSPMPRCANVVSEPRAPVSSTGTFLYSLRTNSRALASLPPGWRSAQAHAAR